MKKIKFKKIDAFTAGGSSGNPAGCIYLESIDDISEDEMQQIARELKGFVNEVVYIFPEDDRYFLRYYSSECEVDFCGHGTIAMMYDYIKNNPSLLYKNQVKIRVKDEILSVNNDILTDDSVYIYAPAPSYLKTSLQHKDVAKALGINENEVDRQFNIDLVNGGLNTLIVPLINLETCLKVLPNQDSLREFCLQNNIDIILVFTNETAFENNDYRTRVFAPKFGYLEDPATGSGNSALAYYLLKKNLWDGNKLILEQSAVKENPNIVKIDSVILDGKRQVIFGGSAIARIDGEYILC